MGASRCDLNTLFAERLSTKKLQSDKGLKAASWRQIGCSPCTQFCCLIYNHSEDARKNFLVSDSSG